MSAPRIDRNQLMERILTHERRVVNRRFIDWCGADAVADNLQRALEDNVSDARAVNAKPPTDTPLLLEVDGRPLVVELRTLADRRQMHHVVVLHRSFDPMDVADLESCARAIAAQFKSFAPEAVQFYLHGNATKPWLSDPRVSIYKHYYAAPLATLQAHDAPAAVDTVEMVTPDSLDFYDDYHRAYERFWAARPDLTPFVRVESPEHLEAYRRGGGLRLVHIGGEWAGVMAALRENERGMSGWCMHERIIFCDHRGRGYGSAVLWSFLNSLDARDGDILFGTIVPQNDASIRSAQRLGREEVGNLMWFELS